jgi:DNA-binding Lrp family transcriptional regulator
MYSVDALDADLLTLLASEPRVGLLAASRRLGVARGTVTARLERLERAGVVRSYGPELDTAALGYAVTAFATLEIQQGRGHRRVAERLAAIPEVLEVHTITGPGDVLARIVARDNADLQRVIDLVVAGEDIVRSSTVIVLATDIAHRTLPLLEAATRR